MKHEAIRTEEGRAREALPLMFKGSIGRRDARGVRVRAWEPCRALLYGPYWRLPAGHWRLRIVCRVSGRPDPDLAFLGVEVIADNRLLCIARDFTPRDCDNGELQLGFNVAPELSESGVKAMFEFRVLHFGRAALAVERVAIEPIKAGDAEPSTSLWRILPRLRPTVLARRTSGGAIVTRARAGRGELVWLLWPHLYLPSGEFVLLLCCGVDRAADSAAPFARIVVTAGNIELLRRDLSTSDIDGEGKCALGFQVPSECSLEAGGAVKIRFSLRQLANGVVTFTSVEVARSDERVVAAPKPRHPAILSGAAKVVIVGNCQAETLCQGFRGAYALKRFEPKYHFVRLSPLHREQGRRDLADCDILLAQAIADWDEYPLRENVKGTTEIIKFPLLRLASPWPFDGYNGPSDGLASEREKENLVFPYLDGRLAKLRAEISDHQARFAAYAELSLAEARLVERLGRYETRRLEAMDREFGCDFGAFINDNFRTSRVFHTTNHPNSALFTRLMDWVARQTGCRLLWVPRRPLDQLGNLQVPVHPEVARILDIRWAGQHTFYRSRGLRTNWEAYVRSYIRHYG